ncbi:MAG: hypothetical protein KGS48_07520 [Bacteroidetes bacterium]|nr:hypothetical protein [Bacteroidota bacterium]
MPVNLLVVGLNHHEKLMRSNCTSLVPKKALTAGQSQPGLVLFLFGSIVDIAPKKKFIHRNLSQFQFFNMKKMFAKIGMPSILSLVFLLGGLFFSSNTAQAQKLVDPAGTSVIKLPNGLTWKSKGAAVTALQTEINNIAQELNSGSASNPLYLKMQATVYLGTSERLDNGMDVPTAALNGFYAVAPAQGLDSSHNTPGMSQSDWNAIYNDLIALLSE